MKRRRVQVPKWVGAMPNPAPPPINYPTLASSRELGKSTASLASQRDLFRPLLFPIDPTVGFFEQIIGVQSSAVVKVTDITGLATASRFEATLSARPVASLTQAPGFQTATANNALASKRSTLWLPFAGEWVVRLGLTGPASIVTVNAQVYDAIDAATYAALQGSCSQVIPRTNTVTTPQPEVRICDALNVSEVVIQYQSSITAGGEPTRLYIGNTTFIYIPRTNIPNGQHTLRLPGAMVSYNIQYQGGALSNSVVASFAFLE